MGVVVGVPQVVDRAGDRRAFGRASRTPLRPGVTASSPSSAGVSVPIAPDDRPDAAGPTPPSATTPTGSATARPPPRTTTGTPGSASRSESAVGSSGGNWFPRRTAADTPGTHSLASDARPSRRTGTPDGPVDPGGGDATRTPPRS